MIYDETRPPHDTAISFRKATGPHMEQNGVVPLQLRETHPDSRQFKPSIAIMHAIPDAREHLALEMLHRCDRSPPEVQDAHPLESSTLQSDVDMEGDRDLEAVSRMGKW
jgi:hypothetical protein